jgi:dephospho-CoA kinase
MIRIGILGDIGAGKSFVAKNFGCPIFNADQEVAKLYESNKEIFIKLKKKLPKFIRSFPIDKKEITNAILTNKKNLDIIIKIIHLEIRKELSIFLKENRKEKIVILDIPLLLENKINNKKDILIFVDSKKTQILKRLKKRKNFNEIIFKKFKNIQLPVSYKKKKSQFIIRNDFTKKNVINRIKSILKKLQK